MEYCKNSVEKLSSPGHTIPNTPIAVDYWSIQGKPHLRIFFLTHCHADHMNRLSPSWSRPIYCSEITAKILPSLTGVSTEFIFPLPIGKPNKIPLDEENKEKMFVTLIDANHCPGAVMFLFEGYFGRVLSTGDFRFEPDSIDLSPILKGPPIDLIYLDNTYWNSAGDQNSDENSKDFPSRSDATKEILELIQLQSLDSKIFISIRKLGKEELLEKIAIELQEFIQVSQEKFNQLKLMDARNVFQTDPARIRAIPFPERNRILFDVLTKEKTPAILIIPSAMPVPIRRDGLDQLTFQIRYSDHSSPTELENFLKLVRPRWVIPCVKQIPADEIFPFLCENGGGIEKFIKSFQIPKSVRIFMRLENEISDQFSPPPRLQGPNPALNSNPGLNSKLGLNSSPGLNSNPGLNSSSGLNSNCIAAGLAVRTFPPPALEWEFQTPESDVKKPESEEKTPERELKRPECHTKKRKSEVKKPESEVKNPESEVKIPESDAKKNDEKEEFLPKRSRRSRKSLYVGIKNGAKEFAEEIEKPEPKLNEPIFVNPDSEAQLTALIASSSSTVPAYSPPIAEPKEKLNENEKKVEKENEEKICQAENSHEIIAEIFPALTAPPPNGEVGEKADQVDEEADEVDEEAVVDEGADEDAIVSAFANQMMTKIRQRSLGQILPQTQSFIPFFPQNENDLEERRFSEKEELREEQVPKERRARKLNESEKNQKKNGLRAKRKNSRVLENEELEDQRKDSRASEKHKLGKKLEDSRASENEELGKKLKDSRVSENEDIGDSEDPEDRSCSGYLDLEGNVVARNFGVQANFENVEEIQKCPFCKKWFFIFNDDRRFKHVECFIQALQSENGLLAEDLEG